ncbi:MAG: hypothetical protein HY238_20290 [Acidobacteria bacterium]|nr:hypothetical protein [Acidobacteriota bacterium]
MVWFRRRAWQPLLWIAVPAAVLAGPWYATNLQTLLPFAWHSAYGQVAPEYGAGGLARWILLFVNEGASAHYALALLVFGGVSLWLAPPKGKPEAYPTLLAWLAPPLVAIAAGRNQLIRFVAPLLPVFAIALAASIFRLGNRWMVQAALALLLAIYPQRLYAALSYFHHGDTHEHAVRWGPLILFSRDLGWAHPPVFEDPWAQRRVLEALHRLSAGARRPRYTIVGFEHVYLNANLLNYLNAYEEYPLLFTSLGYAESSADKAVERIYSFDARFLILPEGFRDLPPFLNQVNREIEDRIARGELPFRLRAKVALAHEMKALLYEREAPWTSFAPGSPPPRPAYPLATDFPGGVRFLGYDWTRRDGRLWQLSCYWTARDRIEQDFRADVEFRRGDRAVLAQDYYLPGLTAAEIVRHDFTVYIPAGDAGPLEARVSLIPWGIGPPLDPVLRLRLPE